MSESDNFNDIKQLRAQIQPCHIGGWSFYPALGLLRNDQEEKRLNEKTLHVLLLLITAKNEACSRKDILDNVWGETYPSDTVVSKAITELRSALGEKAGEQKFIQTLPKFGYQWIGPLSPISPAKENISNEFSSNKTKLNQSLNTRVKLTFTLIGTFLVVFTLLFFSQVYKTPSDSPKSLTLQSSPEYTPITSGYGIEHNPRWSADKEWMVFSALLPNSKVWQLQSYAKKTGQIRDFVHSTDSHAYGAAFSPNELTLAYISMNTEGCSVVKQSFIQGDPEPIAQCTTKFLTTVDWSPDGNMVAFTSEEPQFNSRAIFLTSPTQKKTTQLTRGKNANSSDFYPRFSPNGRHLAFLRGEPLPDHRTELWIIDVDTKQETRIHSHNTKYGGMVWLNDSQLLFSVEEAGKYYSSIANIESSTILPERYQNLKHFEQYSSTELTAVQPRQRLNIISTLKDSKTKLHFGSNYSESYPAISPDGKWLAFISTRTGYDELWIGEIASGQVRQMTQFSGASLRYPHWHPDGQSVLFTTQKDSSEIIRQVNIFSGVISPLESDTYPLTTPSWLPETEHLVFGCKIKDNWGICVNKGAGIEHLIDAHFHPQPISEEEIAIINHQGDVFKFNLTTRKKALLYKNLPNNGRNTWLVTEQFLFFTRHTNKAGEVIKVSLSSGQEEIFYVGAIELLDSKLAYNEKTGDLFITQTGEASDDIVHINNRSKK